MKVEKSSKTTNGHSICKVRAKANSSTRVKAQKLSSNALKHLQTTHLMILIKLIKIEKKVKLKEFKDLLCKIITIMAQGQEKSQEKS